MHNKYSGKQAPIPGFHCRLYFYRLLTMTQIGRKESLRMSHKQRNLSCPLKHMPKEVVCVDIFDVQLLLYTIYQIL